MFSLAGGSEPSLPSEETPWQSDSASVLLPKALLPTPSSRYCQPPPAYRAHQHQRAPLFPVPPPGSCLVPPPPLAGEGGQGAQGGLVVTPCKVERWRKMSWTGEPGELPSPSPTSQPAAFYNYKSSNSLTAPVRRRTLLEVPMQTKTESESVQGNPINIFQSRLDPNSRPFTPAVSGPPSLTEEELQSDPASLSLLTEDSSVSTAGQLSLLPEDPKLFLSELEISGDEKEGKTKAGPSQELKISLPGTLTDSILPPPIFPFTSHWSGKSRPPLLPTPKNFPPFGPRQSGESPGGVFTHHDPPQLSPGPGLASQESLAVRKAGMLRRLSGETKTPLTPGNLGPVSGAGQKSVSEAAMMILSEEEAEAEVGWLPLGLSWMPPSLVESHPTPDEYCVNKVIGPKLPSLKLHNCHTDLLFFIFYSFHCDLQQMLAASLLFDRGWRYHKLDQVWLARWPGLAPERKSSECDWEEGLYQYFDVKVWKRIPGWFRLHYDKLAERPETNPN